MDETEWLLRFASKLHQIQPAADRTVTNDIATIQWDSTPDCVPEEAAEIYALEEPPGKVGAPS